MTFFCSLVEQSNAFLVSRHITAHSTRWFFGRMTRAVVIPAGPGVGLKGVRVA
jgi:hypothetical protein